MSPATEGEDATWATRHGAARCATPIPITTVARIAVRGLAVAQRRRVSILTDPERKRLHSGTDRGAARRQTVHSQALTRAKIAPISSQVRDAGAMRPPSRARRPKPSARNTSAKTATMYFAAKAMCSPGPASAFAARPGRWSETAAFRAAAARGRARRRCAGADSRRAARAGSFLDSEARP